MYLSMAMPTVMKMDADMEMVIPGKRKCGKRIMCTDVVSRKLFRKLSKIDPTRYPEEKKNVCFLVFPNVELNSAFASQMAWLGFFLYEFS